MFRKRPVVTGPPTWLIVGLGNPGAEYRGTRHNVGFEVLDLLADRHRIKLDKSKHQARYGLGAIGDTTVALIRPLTYMNLSGRAVAPFAREFGISPANILVITDDLDLAVGRVRLKPKGSAGGHNGHKSLIASLETTEYPRIKIGIGSVDRNETVDHVLGSFTGDERQRIASALAMAADGAEVCVQDGLERAMNRINENQ
jgi:PTH1 family peptidyl-tRNA hydrolase